MPRIVDRAIRFSTPWFDVIEKAVVGFPGDERQGYFAVQPLDYVSVLAFTPSRQVVLVRQYRPVVEDYTLDLPSGHVEIGQTPEEAARLELLEETGYLAPRLQLLGTLAPDVGRLANRSWCFFAPDVERAIASAAEQETIETVLVTETELTQRVLDGTFAHAQHLAVLLLAVLKQTYRPGEVAAQCTQATNRIGDA